MEASYGVGHKKYRDYPNGNHYTHVGGMFAKQEYRLTSL